MIAMVSESRRTMGEKISILDGRTIDLLKSSAGGSPESSFEVSAGLPVSFRNRLAFPSRIAIG